MGYSRTWTWLLSALLLCCSGEEAFDRAGFSVAWTIESTDGVPLDCEQVGAYQAAFVLTDSTGETHEYWTACDALFFETEAWNAKVGKGTLTASLKDAAGGEIVASDKKKVKLVSGKLKNRLTDVVFQVSPEVYAEHAPGVTGTFLIGDGQGGFSSCEAIGCRYLSVSLVDGAEVSHPFGTVPCEPFVTIDAGPLPFLTLGDAVVEITFLNAGMEVISENSIPYRLSGEGEIAIGPLSGYAPPIATGGPMSLLWQWQYSEQNLDTEQCDRLGIDTVRLWVWHEAAGSWWSDPEWMSAPCQTTEHAVNAALVDISQFSGLFLGDFLPAGAYAFSLCYYRSVEVAGGISSDLLVHLDRVGAPDEPVSFPPESDQGENLVEYVTHLDEVTEGGNLEISLVWQGEDDTFGPCDSVPVSGASFLLKSEAGIAMNIDFDEGVLCRDTLRLPGLSMSSRPYTLAVTGLLPETGKVGWFGQCEGLTPVEEDGDDAVVECAVHRYP
jgi:hypothetical protein